MNNEDKQIDHGDMISNIMMREVEETITVETAFHFTGVCANGATVERVEQTDAGAATRSFYISVV